jgi:ABC-type lipoprotein release transport system permease subunit
LFGLEPNDAGTLAAALAVMALTGLLATVVPPYRATKVSPVTALRES